jgi:type III restriction enzyme
LETHAGVAAYAKNDHLGFQVWYLWRGSRRRFIPDFVLRLVNAKHLVLEIKGEDSEQDRAKRMALASWVNAINARGGFGTWCWDVVKAEPARLQDVIAHHASSPAASASIGESLA